MKKTPPTNKPQPLPDVKFHPGLPERLMEAAALLLVVANWGYIIYMRLAHGNENFTAACVMGVTATISFIIVALCAYAPVKLINFPSRVTPTNAIRAGSALHTCHKHHYGDYIPRYNARRLPRGNSIPLHLHRAAYLVHYNIYCDSNATTLKKRTWASHNVHSSPKSPFFP